MERTEVSNFYRSFIQFAGQLIIKLRPAVVVRKLLVSIRTLKMLKTNQKNWTLNLKYHDMSLDLGDNGDISPPANTYIFLKAPASPAAE